MVFSVRFAIDPIVSVDINVPLMRDADDRNATTWLLSHYATEPRSTVHAFDICTRIPIFSFLSVDIASLNNMTSREVRSLAVLTA